MQIARRHLMFCALSLGATASVRADTLGARLAELERQRGGRLGVCLLDTQRGTRWSHRGEERFAMCSTFKLPLVGAVLQALDQGRLRPEARLPLRPSDRLPWMPATKAWLARGWARPLELAEAAQRLSDGVAANVLMRALGGPEALTAWVRAQGDVVTRFDRYEPELARGAPGDERDTSSPEALAQTVARVCTGAVLRPASRERLVAWMQATQTGQRRLRAGLPAGWRAGDKTGTGLGPGRPDRINDVAVFWPPQRGAWVLACLYEGPTRSTEWVRPEDEAVLAEVARLAADWALRT
jgi:beta-lactamase class A